MDIKEVARMGGLATLKKYGKKHFVKLALDREERKKIEKIRKQIIKDKEKL